MSSLIIYEVVSLGSQHIAIESILKTHLEICELETKKATLIRSKMYFCHTEQP